MRVHLPICICQHVCGPRLCLSLILSLCLSVCLPLSLPLSLCMCVRICCVCVYVSVCVCVCTNTHTHTHTCIHRHIHTHTHTHAYTYTYIHIHIHTLQELFIHSVRTTYDTSNNRFVNNRFVDRDLKNGAFLHRAIFIHRTSVHWNSTRFAICMCACVCVHVRVSFCVCDDANASSSHWRWTCQATSRHTTDHTDPTGRICSATPPTNRRCEHRFVWMRVGAATSSRGMQACCSTCKDTAHRVELHARRAGRRGGVATHTAKT